MCTAVFKGLASLNQKMPHSKLQQKIGANDPLSKELGYEGLADPLQEAEARFAGTQTELQRKQNRLQNARAIAARTAERPSTTGHILSIAAKKAVSGRS